MPLPQAANRPPSPRGPRLPSAPNWLSQPRLSVVVQQHPHPPPPLDRLPAAGHRPPSPKGPRPPSPPLPTHHATSLPSHCSTHMGASSGTPRTQQMMAVHVTPASHHLHQSQRSDSTSDVAITTQRLDHVLQQLGYPWDPPNRLQHLKRLGRAIEDGQLSVLDRRVAERIAWDHQLRGLTYQLYKSIDLRPPALSFQAPPPRLQPPPSSLPPLPPPLLATPPLRHSSLQPPPEYQAAYPFAPYHQYFLKHGTSPPPGWKPTPYRPPPSRSYSTHLSSISSVSRPASVLGGGSSIWTSSAQTSSFWSSTRGQNEANNALWGDWDDDFDFPAQSQDEPPPSATPAAEKDGKRLEADGYGSNGAGNHAEALDDLDYDDYGEQDGFEAADEHNGGYDDPIEPPNDPDDHDDHNVSYNDSANFSDDPGEGHDYQDDYNHSDDYDDHGGYDDYGDDFNDDPDVEDNY